MVKKDYYDILGVNKSSSETDVKKAYRKLAMKYHPDRNPGNHESEKKFKEATNAYEILRDPQKKSAYDQYGHDAFNQNRGQSGGFEGFSDFNDIFNNFSDLFGGSGGGRKRSSAVRGSDIRYNISITLEESYRGIDKNINFSVASKCGFCNGSGAEGNSSPTSCGTCNGSGKIRSQQGFFVVERACTSCSGTGQIIKNKCKKCYGEGRVNKEKKLSVKIPAGVEDGNRIRLAEEGESGAMGGTNGDLYLFISVERHKFFDRDGSDIRIEIPIKMTTASLGGSVEIPTIDGSKAKLTIPEGSQTNNQFRLKGKGMVMVNSGGRKGDMYVKIFVETPVKLSIEEKTIMRELDKSIGDISNPRSEGFFKKVSDLFK